MVVTSDKNGRTDSAYHTLVKKIDSKYPIVMVSWVEDFIFNETLLNIKNYVLICFCEYGWNYEIKDSHIWGRNTDKKGYGDGRYKGGEWDKFDNWVKENPFKIMFKRELLKKDVSDNVLPIEYPCIGGDYPFQSEQSFNERPINVFQYWGRSNENRLRIHGEIWLHSYKKGFQVCDNIYYLNKYLVEEKGEKWVTIWIPHYERVEIANILDINSFSKLSLSWAGAGFKCFRNGESPINSIMVMHKNNYAWTYDWNESDCVLVEPMNEIEDIETALKRTDLYNVYKAGVENCNKYRLSNYIPYIENKINSCV